MWVEEDSFIRQSFDSHSKVEERKGFEIELSDSSKNNLGDNGGGGGGSREFFFNFILFIFWCCGCLLCCGKEYVSRWWLTRAEGGGELMILGILVCTCLSFNLIFLFKKTDMTVQLEDNMTCMENNFLLFHFTH